MSREEHLVVSDLGQQSVMVGDMSTEAPELLRTIKGDSMARAGVETRGKTVPVTGSGAGNRAGATHRSRRRRSSTMGLLFPVGRWEARRGGRAFAIQEHF